MPDFNPAAFRSRIFDPSSRLDVAILISVIFHVVVLFGITFKLPIPKFTNEVTPLQVVLVNSKSTSKPHKTNTLAQANLDGGGNTDDNRRAKTPFPLPPTHRKSIDVIQAKQKTKQLEQEAKRLMTAVISKQNIHQSNPRLEQSGQGKKIPDAYDLIQRSREIIRLEAQIAKDYEAYQKRPRRKFIGARTKEYRFARYIEDWRIKVERIGNLNYPEAAKQEGLYGNLQLTVGIMADGNLESIEINRSSGKKILDEAAIRIVKLAGQNGFSPFPPEISRDTDILHITRTWLFTRSDELMSK
ncbi:MAG: energy transducer TonB [Betaproteobacteria bacterium]|nr:MAG: energy transducer TonB [Betaproteobacteria bacterium]TDI81346.1 MAG: energy transducer TonB [Betaproteobacteria bacterium]